MPVEDVHPTSRLGYTASACDARTDKSYGFAMMPSTSFLYTCVKWAGAATGTGVVLALSGLWYFQRHLIYPAYVPGGSRQNVAKPSLVGLPYEDVTITTSDKVKIKAYVIPARRTFISTAELKSMNEEQRKAAAEKEIERWTKEMGEDDAVEYARSRPTVVIFHANAGNMGHRVPLARKLNVDNRCNVFMLSYRGYGHSEGHPSERGIKLDIESAMEYISGHPLIGGTKIVVYGQSIGGAVALYAASRFPDMVSGVIVENTFLSLAKVVPDALPYLPPILLPVLLTEQWDTTKSLPLIPKRVPVLFLSGKRDELVPPSHMKELKRLREASGGKCTFKELDGTHNDTWLVPGYWDSVRTWMQEEIEGGSAAEVKIENH